MPALKTKYLTVGLRVAEPPAGRMEPSETAKSAAAFAFPGIFQGLVPTLKTKYLTGGLRVDVRAACFQ
jgi:hypothetical protein